MSGTCVPHHTECARPCLAVPGSVDQRTSSSRAPGRRISNYESRRNHPRRVRTTVTTIPRRIMTRRMPRPGRAWAARHIMILWIFQFPMDPGCAPNQRQPERKPQAPAEAAAGHPAARGTPLDSRSRRAESESESESESGTRNGGFPDSLASMDPTRSHHCTPSSIQARPFWQSRFREGAGGRSEIDSE
jgi:hypothetical protein